MTTTEHTVAGFFSGTGGIELGFNNAGFSTSYSNEWDKHAGVTYATNFGETHLVLEDINAIKLEGIPATTVVAGGFPCQAFSIAGHRLGFDDSKGRGNLFFRIAEIVEEKQPEVVFLENVKNLVTHDNGNTFVVILETLAKLGYYVKHKVMNAKDYGNVPQGRERIYIVGFKSEDAYNKFEFPEQIPLTTKLSDVIDFENKVDEKYYYTAIKNPNIFDTIAAGVLSEDSVYQWRRQYVRENKSGVAPTLTANMGTGGHNVPLVTTKHGIRKLTPRECFNLMGFPSDYKLPALADMHLYKQSGNAVVVTVIKRIAEKIEEALA